jgi:hypothetical protein
MPVTAGSCEARGLRVDGAQGAEEAAVGASTIGMEM